MTPTVIAVADDLTGANSTAAGLARDGWRAVTCWIPPTGGLHNQLPGPEAEALVIDTGGRNVTPTEAARRVSEVLGHFPGSPALVANRIDSTLRGAVGATTAAVLRHVHRSTGHRTVALCAPAHPQAGRVTVGGHHLVGGDRLDRSEAAHDPLAPVATSSIRELLTATADLRVANLDLADVTSGQQAISDRLADLLQDPKVDVIVCDALIEQHLAAIARAANEMSGNANAATWVCVDSGPLTRAMAAQLRTRPPSSPVLAVSTSTTSATAAQLARLADDHEVARVDVDPTQVDAPRLTKSLQTALDKPGGSGPRTVLIACPPTSTRLSHQAATELPGSLARVVSRAVAGRPIGGLYATGGETASALLHAFGVRALDVEGELEPLTVAATVSGGPHHGLPVVTKGGLVGNTQTASSAVTHLHRRARDQRRQIRTETALTNGGSR